MNVGREVDDRIDDEVGQCRTLDAVGSAACSNGTSSPRTHPPMTRLRDPVDPATRRFSSVADAAAGGRSPSTWPSSSASSTTPGGIPERYEDMLVGLDRVRRARHRRPSSSSSASTRSGGATSACRDLWPLVRARRSSRWRCWSLVFVDRAALPRRPAALGRGLRPRCCSTVARRRRPPAAPLASSERPDARGAQRRKARRRARRRRRLRRPDGRPRAAAQPEPRQPRDRLRRRRPAQARHAQPRAQGARRRPTRSARSSTARSPTRSSSRSPRRRARCAARSSPPAASATSASDAADRLRAAARRRPAHPPAPRGPGRGRARPRARGDGARPRRRLPPGPDRPRHRRRRLDRRRALAARSPASIRGCSSCSTTPRTTSSRSTAS